MQCGPQAYTLTIPAHWTITYGPLFPATKGAWATTGGNPNVPTGTMRIYEGKAQRGVIRNVDYFMDTRVKVEMVPLPEVKELELEVKPSGSVKKKPSKRPNSAGKAWNDLVKAINDTEAVSATVPPAFDMDPVEELFKEKAF